VDGWIEVWGKEKFVLKIALALLHLLVEYYGAMAVLLCMRGRDGILGVLGRRGIAWMASGWSENTSHDHDCWNGFLYCMLKC
jgi:hypothetical protein